MCFCLRTDAACKCIRLIVNCEIKLRRINDNAFSKIVYFESYRIFKACIGSCKSKCTYADGCNNTVSRNCSNGIVIA